MRQSIAQPRLTCRALFSQIGGGFGALGLAGVLAEADMLGPVMDAPPAKSQNTEGEALNHPLASRPPHFPARAKRVIFLFMNGGPSHVDTFDPNRLWYGTKGSHRQRRLSRVGPRPER